MQLPVGGDTTLQQRTVLPPQTTSLTTGHHAPSSMSASPVQSNDSRELNQAAQFWCSLFERCEVW